MINSASECSVRVFMKCLFDKEYQGLNGGDWDKIYTQYMDLSGIGETRQKVLLVLIHNTGIRIMNIPNMIGFQIEYMKVYGEPYFDGFSFFVEYGIRLTWDENDAQGFINQLKRVLITEKRFVAEIDKHNKELSDLKAGIASPENDSGRKGFIKLLNKVSAWRHIEIDRDKVDMESYSMMVMDYFENAKDKIVK